VPSEDDLEVGPGLVVPGGELELRFGPSGGPGGQHANRAHTRVELRLDLRRCTALTEGQRARLTARLGDEVRVVVDEERSQHRNRELARRRLAARLRAALVVPRSRTATRPTRGSQRRRVESKRRRADLKRSRRRPPSSADD
jgi:ribosome-associated protein